MLVWERAGERENMSTKQDQRTRHQHYEIKEIVWFLFNFSYCENKYLVRYSK
jgi:hypothetical protein